MDTTCGGCGEVIHLTNPGPPEQWAVYVDTVDGHTGALIHRTYVHGCEAECISHHFPANEDDNALEPKRVGHPSNPPVSAESVRGGYEGLVRSINRANRLLPEGDRFHVPFGVQEALVAYIEEREAIESITRESS